MSQALQLAEYGSKGVGLAFKNRIINGAMMIDQRNAGASKTITDTVATTYTLDRWYGYGTVASKFSIQQNAGSVTTPASFNKYLGCTSASAYTVGAGELFIIGQSVEGFNIADLNWGTANAKTVTLSFQVYSSLTGTFGGSVLNGGQSRSYPFTYSVPVANTWTTISVTITGDTTGTWATDNSVGLKIYWGLGVGSTYSGTAGAWASASYFSATGATSVVGTNGATFYITGVQLEVGTTATSFDYRPYGTELALCQRYFCKSSNTDVVATNNAGFSSTGMFTSGTINTFSSGNGYLNWIKYPVSMRSQATTVTFINANLPNPGTSGQWSVFNGTNWTNTSSISTQTGTTEGFGAIATFSGTAYMYYGSWTASAEL